MIIKNLVNEEIQVNTQQIMKGEEKNLINIKEDSSTQNSSSKNEVKADRETAMNKYCTNIIYSTP